MKATSLDAGTEDIPPPLPTKEKQRSQSSMIDYMSVSTPTSDQRSPSRSPVSSAQLTPNQSPYNSMIEGSPTHDLSFSSDLVTPISQSPYSTSPSSSIGSGLNQSTEDLLGSASQKSSASSGVMRFPADMMKARSFSSLQTGSPNLEQFNQIAREINKLTLATKSEEPPPIPVKRVRQRLQRGQSEYDNVPDGAVHVSSSSSSVVSRTFLAQTFFSNCDARISSSSSSSNQSFSGQIQKSNTISFSQHSSSSETFSSLESLPNPPPLPPKNRHSKLLYCYFWGKMWSFVWKNK